MGKNKMKKPLTYLSFQCNHEKLRNVISENGGSKVVPARKMNHYLDVTMKGAIIPLVKRISVYPLINISNDCQISELGRMKKTIPGWGIDIKHYRKESETYVFSFRDGIVVERHGNEKDSNYHVDKFKKSLDKFKQSISELNNLMPSEHRVNLGY